MGVSVRDLHFSVPSDGGPMTIAQIPCIDIPAGEMTVLAGPSGSGKSTLLYLLAGLLAPQQGSILWNDIDLARLNEAARDRWRLGHAGFVFQSFNLIDELSPLENVLLPARFSSMSVDKYRDRAATLLTDLDVPVHRRRAALLSRGEQQRVAIARALLRDPAVIFADEPTASLDAAAGRNVTHLLRELATRQGRTVIVASHDPALLERAARVIRLDHGRVVQDDGALAA